MEDLEANMKKLEAVRVLGVSVAIDDFGTGYSSLGYLAKLPVHSLKIDRSFIITMLKDPAVLTLVSTIISMAHSLRLQVVAEGVDAEEQAKVLDRLGLRSVARLSLQANPSISTRSPSSSEAQRRRLNALHAVQNPRAPDRTRAEYLGRSRRRELD